MTGASSIDDNTLVIDDVFSNRWQKISNSWQYMTIDDEWEVCLKLIVNGLLVCVVVRLFIKICLECLATLYPIGNLFYCIYINTYFRNISKMEKIRNFLLTLTTFCFAILRMCLCHNSNLCYSLLDNYFWKTQACCLTCRYVRVWIDDAPGNRWRVRHL